MGEGIAHAAPADPWREGGAWLRTCEAPRMIERVHSLLVVVPDLATASNDYARLLGADPVRRERDAATGASSAFFAVANTVLELREASASERVGQAGLRLSLAGDGPAADEGGVLASALAERGLEVAASGAARGEGDDDPGDLRQYGRVRLADASCRGLPVELVHGETVAIEPRALDPDPSRVASLDHLVVMSPAPDDTARFYGERLGIRLALDKSFEARGVRLLFFRVGGTTIEIGARLAATPEPEKRDRFGGLAWQVPDIEAIHSRLAADGFDVSETRPGNKEGTFVCTVRDPVHGVPTLLIQPVARG